MIYLLTLMVVNKPVFCYRENGWLFTDIFISHFSAIFVAT
jgi:hypothetical protein